MSNIPYAVDYEPKRKSETLLRFANHINRTKPGSKGELTFLDPEYYVMENLVSDEMAEVGMGLRFKEKLRIEEIAKNLERKPEEIEDILWNLVKSGAVFFETHKGEKVYWLELWVPGHMEAFMNHPEWDKYPEVGIAFDAYGKKKGLIAPGVIPMGMSPMRVIPIERSIDGSSRKATFEEVSHYLNTNTRFSVSNCSCRTVRESMGEGCGHLKEDMCIQLGHAAEFYIATGRAREITREEAYEIIERAEENGLMHEIPNLDGSGETHAICNCCGCGCLALRNANMFHNPDFVRSNYRAVIDEEKCVACGECVEHCPVNALRLGQKIKSTEPVHDGFEHKDKPDNTKWTVNHWNPDYRENMKVVMDTGTSPCKSKCPAHIAVQGYVKLASEGKFKEALELIKEENPLPAVCGHICPRYCEEACTRNSVDESVAVDEIKKFIAMQDLKEEHRFIPRIRHDYHDKKIAVIGSGPAGLSCAYYLARDGYSVEVFEKEEVLGGMLHLGIPSFRLEKDVLQGEIDCLKEMGVIFNTGVEIGKDKTLDDLRKEGFKAIYLAIGANKGRRLNLEGEEAKNVFTGLEFLREINLHEKEILKGHVLVIGGGNVAIDVARGAIRAGAEEVTLVSLEEEHEMPALPEEIEEAKEEGVHFIHGYGPMELNVTGDILQEVIFKKCTQVKDASGAFNPQYDETDTKTLSCEFMITSVGQTFDYKDILKDEEVEFNPSGSLKANPLTYQVKEDLFTGGDVYTGPRFAIDAIAQGKEGAISIHRYVNPGQSLTIGRLRRNYESFNQELADVSGFDKLKRHTPGVKEGTRKSFRDMRDTFTLVEMKEEANRCLSCGRAYVDDYMCLGCGQCTTKCHFGAISLEKVSDVESVTIKELKPLVVKNVIKTKAKTAIHSVKKLVSND